MNLILTRRYLLVFVEVKYRFDSEQIATPTPRQCQRIKLRVSLSLARYPSFSNYQCRFNLFIVSHGKFFGVGHFAYFKMLGNTAYITLTDESQNATLTQRLLD